MLRKTVFVTVVSLVVWLIASGCNPQVDSSVATFNANATKVASGGKVLGTLVVTPLPGPTATPTPLPNTYDLTADQTQLLVHAWGQIYGLPANAEFEVIASSQQVTKFVIDNLQVQAGLADTVKGGNVTLGNGQLRLDLALVDTTGASGGGTVTFQPGLDGAVLKLQVQGSDFGSLSLPPALIPSLGDAVHTALTGAKDDSLSKVTLRSLSLEDGVIRLVGVVK